MSGNAGADCVSGCKRGRSASGNSGPTCLGGCKRGRQSGPCGDSLRELDACLWFPQHLELVRPAHGPQHSCLWHCRRHLNDGGCREGAISCQGAKSQSSHDVKSIASHATTAGCRYGVERRNRPGQRCVIWLAIADVGELHSCLHALRAGCSIDAVNPYGWDTGRHEPMKSIMFS